MKNVNLRSIQAAMGHKSIQMTARYAHLSSDYELAVVEKLCEDTNKDGAALEQPTDTRTSTRPNEASGSDKTQLQ